MIKSFQASILQLRTAILRVFKTTFVKYQPLAGIHKTTYALLTIIIFEEMPYQQHD
jgi:hypothetical protein